MSMSMQTTSEPLEDEPGRSGVRVYRGRKMSDVLPTIRAELGPEAVILRHREGVGGGVGGFFAHRFVEVEAMPGAPRVNVFDDEDVAAGDILEDLFRAPSAPPAPAPSAGVAAPAEDLTQPSGAQAFLERLAAAAAEAPPVAEPVAAEPVVTEATVVEPVAAEPIAVPVDAPPAPALTAARAVSGTATGKASVSLNGPVPTPRSATVPLPASAPRPRVNGAASVYAETAAASAAPAVPEPPAAPLVPVAPEPPTVTSDAMALAPATVVAAPEARVQSTDRETANAIAEELIGRGMGTAPAEAFIIEAASHVLPFVPGADLREAVRRTIARRLSGLAAPPSGGSVVAFVGAGGSGKTRCVAGLAAAYQGTSTLTTSCLSVMPDDGGSELNGLLRAHGIAVRASDEGAGAAWLASVRDAGLIIIDTPAFRVNDDASVQALVNEVDALEPDHVLITLPATLSAAAARQLLDRLGALAPTGIVITHVDETDQLGVAVDLACDSGLPLAYLHDGLSLPGALVPADPQDIAGRLLP